MLSESLARLLLQHLATICSPSTAELKGNLISYVSAICGTSMPWAETHPWISTFQPIAGGNYKSKAKRGLAFVGFWVMTREYPLLYKQQQSLVRLRDPRGAGARLLMRLRNLLSKTGYTPTASHPSASPKSILLPSQLQLMITTIPSASLAKLEGPLCSFPVVARSPKLAHTLNEQTHSTWPHRQHRPERKLSPFPKQPLPHFPP